MILCNARLRDDLIIVIFKNLKSVYSRSSHSRAVVEIHIPIFKPVGITTRPKKSHTKTLHFHIKSLLYELYHYQ